MLLGPHGSSSSSVSLSAKSGTVDGEMNFTVTNNGIELRGDEVNTAKRGVHFSAPLKTWWTDVRFACVTIHVFGSQTQAAEWVSTTKAFNIIRSFTNLSQVRTIRIQIWRGDELGHNVEAFKGTIEPNHHVLPIYFFGDLQISRLGMRTKHRMITTDWMLKRLPISSENWGWYPNFGLDKIAGAAPHIEQRPSKAGHRKRRLRESGMKDYFIVCGIR